MSRLQIRKDDLTGQKIADLLREHLENLNEITPPESVHALEFLDGLGGFGITRMRGVERTRFNKR